MKSKENIIMNTNDTTNPATKADAGAKIGRNRLKKLKPHEHGVQGLEQYCQSD